MKITEQIDALRSLAVYPTEYLIVPRFLAMLISMPILVGLAITCGVGRGLSRRGPRAGGAGRLLLE